MDKSVKSVFYLVVGQNPSFSGTKPQILGFQKIQMILRNLPFIPHNVGEISLEIAKEFAAAKLLAHAAGAGNCHPECWTSELLRKPRELHEIYIYIYIYIYIDILNIYPTEVVTYQA